MGFRDDKYLLGEEVELDEGFFKTVSSDRDKSEPLKRGRGSQQQSKVLVSAESKDSKDAYNPKKHSKTKRVKFIKMKTIVSLKKDDIKSRVDQMLENNTKINSDKSNSYNDLEPDFKLNSQVIKKQDINKIDTIPQSV